MDRQQLEARENIQGLANRLFTGQLHQDDAHAPRKGKQRSRSMHEALLIAEAVDAKRRIEEEQRKHADAELRSLLDERLGETDETRRRDEQSLEVARGLAAKTIMQLQRISDFMQLRRVGDRPLREITDHDALLDDAMRQALRPSGCVSDIFRGNLNRIEDLIAAQQDALATTALELLEEEERELFEAAKNSIAAQKVLMQKCTCASRYDLIITEVEQQARRQGQLESSELLGKMIMVVVQGIRQLEASCEQYVDTIAEVRGANSLLVNKLEQLREYLIARRRGTTDTAMQQSIALAQERDFLEQELRLLDAMKRAFGAEKNPSLGAVVSVEFGDDLTMAPQDREAKSPWVQRVRRRVSLRQSHIRAMRALEGQIMQCHDVPPPCEKIARGMQTTPEDDVIGTAAWAAKQRRVRATMERQRFGDLPPVADSVATNFAVGTELKLAGIDVALGVPKSISEALYDALHSAKDIMLAVDFARVTAVAQLIQSLPEEDALPTALSVASLQRKLVDEVHVSIDEFRIAMRRLKEGIMRREGGRSRRIDSQLAPNDGAAGRGAGGILNESFISASETNSSVDESEEHALVSSVSSLVTTIELRSGRTLPNDLRNPQGQGVISWCCGTVDYLAGLIHEVFLPKKNPLTVVLGIGSQTLEPWPVLEDYVPLDDVKRLETDIRNAGTALCRFLRMFTASAGISELPPDVRLAVTTGLLPRRVQSCNDVANGISRLEGLCTQAAELAASPQRPRKESVGPAATTEKRRRRDSKELPPPVKPGGRKDTKGEALLNSPTQPLPDAPFREARARAEVVENVKAIACGLRDCLMYSVHRAMTKEPLTKAVEAQYLTASIAAESIVISPEDDATVAAALSQLTDWSEELSSLLAPTMSNGEDRALGVLQCVRQLYPSITADAAEAPLMENIGARRSATDALVSTLKSIATTAAESGKLRWMWPTDPTPLQAIAAVEALLGEMAALPTHSDSPTDRPPAGEKQHCTERTLSATEASRGGRSRTEYPGSDSEPRSPDERVRINTRRRNRQMSPVNSRPENEDRIEEPSRHQGPVAPPALQQAVDSAEARGHRALPSWVTVGRDGDPSEESSSGQAGSSQIPPPTPLEACSLSLISDGALASESAQVPRHRSIVLSPDEEAVLDVESERRRDMELACSIDDYSLPSRGGASRGSTSTTRPPPLTTAAPERVAKQHGSPHVVFATANQNTRRIVVSSPEPGSPHAEPTLDMGGIPEGESQGHPLQGGPSIPSFSPRVGGYKHSPSTRSASPRSVSTRSGVSSRSASPHGHSPGGDLFLSNAEVVDSIDGNVRGGDIGDGKDGKGPTIERSRLAVPQVAGPRSRARRRETLEVPRRQRHREGFRNAEISAAPTEVGESKSVGGKVSRTVPAGGRQSSGLMIAGRHSSATANDAEDEDSKATHEKSQETRHQIVEAMRRPSVRVVGTRLALVGSTVGTDHGPEALRDAESEILEAESRSLVTFTFPPTDDATKKPSNKEPSLKLSTTTNTNPPTKEPEHQRPTASVHEPHHALTAKVSSKDQSKVQSKDPSKLQFNDAHGGTATVRVAPASNPEALLNLFEHSSSAVRTRLCQFLVGEPVRELHDCVSELLLLLRVGVGLGDAGKREGGKENEGVDPVATVQNDARRLTEAITVLRSAPSQRSVPSRASAVDAAAASLCADPAPSQPRAHAAPAWTKGTLGNLTPVGVERYGKRRAFVQNELRLLVQQRKSMTSSPRLIAALLPPMRQAPTPTTSAAGQGESATALPSSVVAESVPKALNPPLQLWHAHFSMPQPQARRSPKGQTESPTPAMGRRELGVSRIPRLSPLDQRVADILRRPTPTDTALP